jgi:Zn-dependent metalloprotease
MARYVSFCSILPPYILENIERRGRPNQRKRARETLQHDVIMRGARSQTARPVRPFRRSLQLRRLELLRRMWAAGLDCKVQRKIHDGQNGQRLPGLLVRKEGDPATGDDTVTEAFDGFGATFDLYDEEYDRCSIDDRGIPLVGTVHHKQGYDNAFWDGQQMVFGDGDEDLPENERLFNRFTKSIDIIGHELTHGVTERTAGLVYWFQPGALNESLSDVFGSIVKQRSRSQTADEADWLIGEGLFTANVESGTPGEPVALRSMKAPGTAYNDDILGKDPQPGHMREYRRLPWWDDNGGVHINSGIPNRAFYLTAVKIGGNSWENAGHIWYETLVSPNLKPLAQFQQFAQETIAAAIDLFGFNSTEHQAVREAWAEVGIAAPGFRARWAA